MDYECIGCGTIFKRYSTIQRLCGTCSRAKASRRSSAPRAPLRRRQKPIRQRGKVANQDRIFLLKVVRPYLDKKYGRACFDCGVMPPIKEDGTYGYHDADHGKSKGAHPGDRFDVTHFRYRCRPCHIKKTGIPQWTRKAPA